MNIFWSSRFPSYATSIVELQLRRALRGDKILKGVETAILSEEQMRKFKTVVNLKAAKQIGVTIPPHVLARADKVIR
jgi:putative ABC transport system substrate-binding protein